MTMQTQNGARVSRQEPLKRPAMLLLCSALACCLATTVAVSAEPSSSLFGRFLQFTDIHPDEHYLDGAAVSISCHTILSNDTTPTNLRKGRFNLHSQEKSSEKVLTVQDMSIIRPGLMGENDDGVNDNGTGGFYGAPNTICDSPMSLADATFEWMHNNLRGSLDFVVWTGDNARHDSDNTHPRTQEEINEMNDAIAQRVLQAFPPGPDGKRLPIIPSIGNNDVYPHNIMYPGPSPVLQHYANIWSEFIPESQINTFRRGGYYSSEVVPGKITVFGLNTLYFYLHNAAVDGCKIEEEPGTEQMDWLETELESLRERKMVAYLTGHVPPERKSYSPTCYSRYTKIALEYHDVIVGHLYGHANIDHFFLLSEDKKGEAQLLEKDDRINVLEEEDHDPFHLMGLSSYLEGLWKQYDDIPRKAKLNNYAIVHVSPSVIPTYQPTLRVFTYELSDKPTAAIEQSTQSEDQDNQEEQEEEEGQEMDDEELEVYFSAQLNNDVDIVQAIEKKYKKPSNPKPVPVTTFGYPLGFIQYWANLTLANEGPTPPEFEIEYQTRQDYGLQNLGVSEYLALARRISKNSDLKKEYLKRMVVQTGAENNLPSP